MRSALPLAMALLVLAPALGGCTFSGTGETVVLDDPRGPRPGFGMPPRTMEVRVADGTRTSGAERDGPAPPVFHDGIPATAVALAVRDREAGAATAPGVSTFRDRYPCGGAVMAIAEGAPDPRKLLVDGAGAGHLPPVTYEASRMVTDGWGREWTTDVYSATQETTGRTWRIWVASVGGGLAFTPDDGRSSCAPFEYGGSPFNAVVHTWGHEGGTDLYYAPMDRFPVPLERDWVLGPVE